MDFSWLLLVSNYIQIWGWRNFPADAPVFGFIKGWRLHLPKASVSLALSRLLSGICHFYFSVSGFLLQYHEAQKHVLSPQGLLNSLVLDLA